MAIKYEKITLWTSTPIYNESKWDYQSALNEIIYTLGELGEFKVLDYATEEYKLVKASTRQPKAKEVAY